MSQTLDGPCRANRADGVRLMDNHVNLLRPALVTAQAADQPPYHEIRSEALGERRRAEHGRVLAFETDRADI
jgi:hypothetical protein